MCTEFLKKEDFYIRLYAQFTGTGAFILTLYLDNQKRKKNYINLFILFTVVFSIFEYVVGFALDALFAERWWDYSENKYNLNGRITILNSFLWGVTTVLFTRFIYPLIQKFKEKIIYKIPCKVQIFVALILVIGISVDFILSCVKYLS